MENKKNIIMLIISWPLMIMGSQELAPASNSPPGKPYNIFIVQHADNKGPNNLHQLLQVETVTIAELKINIAHLIQIPPTLFKLILDHKKEYEDTFEHEPHRTLQSYFANTKSAWLFTLPVEQPPTTASSSSSTQPAQSAQFFQNVVDEEDESEDGGLMQFLQGIYLK